MKSSEFVSKFKSWYLWKNLIAMAVVVVLLCLGAKFGLDIYTHHGEAIAIPNLKHMQLADAKHILSNLGLEVQVVDTGYTRTPAGQPRRKGLGLRHFGERPPCRCRRKDIR